MVVVQFPCCGSVLRCICLSRSNPGGDMVRRLVAGFPRQGDREKGRDGIVCIYIALRCDNLGRKTSQKHDFVFVLRARLFMWGGRVLVSASCSSTRFFSCTSLSHRKHLRSVIRSDFNKIPVCSSQLLRILSASSASLGLVAPTPVSKGVELSKRGGRDPFWWIHMRHLVPLFPSCIHRTACALWKTNSCQKMGWLVYSTFQKSTWKGSGTSAREKTGSTSAPSSRP